jgi:hypothetical protein
MKVNGLTNDEVKSHLQVSNPASPLTFIHPLHIHPSISAPGDEDSLPLFVVTWICNMSDDAVGSSEIPLHNRRRPKQFVDLL